jgi:hypothetical protein
VKTETAATAMLGMDTSCYLNWSYRFRMSVMAVFSSLLSSTACARQKVETYVGGY